MKLLTEYVLETRILELYEEILLFKCVFFQIRAYSLTIHKSHDSDGSLMLTSYIYWTTAFVLKNNKKTPDFFK